MKTDTNAMRAAAVNLRLAWSADDEIQAANEIDALRSQVAEMADNLTKGHDYLMQIEPEKMTVADTLVAFGWDENGHVPSGEVSHGSAEKKL